MNTKHEKTATALKYQGLKIPTIEASGQAEMADEIIRLAQEHKIPLMENPELACLLAHCGQADQVPSWLEFAVQEILAFAFAMQGKSMAQPTDEKSINPDLDL